MDIFLNIASVALAVAALVPVLMSKGRVGLWTLTAATITIVALLAAYQAQRAFAELAAVRTVRAEISALLGKQEKGLPFEQVYDQLYYRSLLIANKSLDSLVADGDVLHEKRSCVDDSDGTKYSVRRYYLRPN